jgi:hypothetical protein
MLDQEANGIKSNDAEMRLLLAAASSSGGSGDSSNSALPQDGSNRDISENSKEATRQFSEAEQSSCANYATASLADTSIAGNPNQNPLDCAATQRCFTETDEKNTSENPLKDFEHRLKNNSLYNRMPCSKSINKLFCSLTSLITFIYS